MARNIEIECRVQYRRGKRWFTIDRAGDAAIVLSGDAVALLERWQAWFEASQLAAKPAASLCPICLFSITEQGHSPDCIYGMTRSLFDGA